MFASVRSFVLSLALATCMAIQFVSVDATTKNGQTQNVNTNIDINSKHHIRDRPPGYWPKYSGTRLVRLLDGIWNASQVESLNAINDESVNNRYRTQWRMRGNFNNSNIDHNIRFDSMDPNIDISKINTNDRVTIPSTVEVIVDPEHGYLPGYMGYRGVSFFRTRFETNREASKSTHESMGDRLSNGPAARIQFQACSFYCRVWLNGVEIGDHTAGGYVAWSLDISDDVLELGRKHQPHDRPHHLRTTRGRESTEFDPSEGSIILTHELFVLVDNRFNSTTAPLHTGGDFWHYGGIMRSVEWHDRPNPSSILAAIDTNSKENKAGSYGGTLVRGDPDESFSHKELTTVNSVAKNDDDSKVTIASADVTRSTVSKLQRKPMLSSSGIWPWRLYVGPQENLRSVKLCLQLVGVNVDERFRADADLLKELRHNNQIKIYFDGNDTANALDDVEIATRVDGDAVFGPTDIRTITGRGNDRLLELGRFLVPNPRIWSTTDPQLHTVSVNLNGAIVTERFGLRFWDTGTFSDDSALDSTSNKETIFSNTTDKSTNSQIRLNGKILKLMGWNHHSQWPYTAASPTNEQLDGDIRLLKESGHANFVRGAHYPQDPRWLDRLDEHGIVVWSETLGPGVSVSDLQNKYFLKAQNRQVHEMIDNGFNHASIAFWGFFNEGPSNHEEACEGYRASSDAIQSRDTSRFVTYASNQRPPRDKCYEVATVISYNGYPGWYDPREPEDYWNSLASELRSGMYPGAFGKPILVSETGAGGIYEWKHNRTLLKWTLGYQTSIIARDVATVIENANLSGIALWHLFDFKVDDRWEDNTHCEYLPDVHPKTCGYIHVDVGKASGRPGGANHKGSLDFFRRPKSAFWVVASQYERNNFMRRNCLTMT